jgi:hypothetical protein
MKPSAYLKLQPGRLVDQEALASALVERRSPAGPGSFTPPSQSTRKPVLKWDNITLTSHLAAPPRRADELAVSLAAAWRVLRGGRARFIVNPQVWTMRASRPGSPAGTPDGEVGPMLTDFWEMLCDAIGPTRR